MASQVLCFRMPVDELSAAVRRHAQLLGPAGPVDLTISKIDRAIHALGDTARELEIRVLRFLKIAPQFQALFFFCAFRNFKW